MHPLRYAAEAQTPAARGIRAECSAIGCKEHTIFSRVLYQLSYLARRACRCAEGRLAGAGRAGLVAWGA